VLLDELRRGRDFGAGDVHLLSDATELVLAQLGQMVGDDRPHVGLGLALRFEEVKLQQQALAQVARPDAHRLLLLQLAQHRLDLGGLHLQDARHLRDAALQEAALVQVADQELGDRHLLQTEHRAELAHQALRQGHLGGDVHHRIEVFVRVAPGERWAFLVVVVLAVAIAGLVPGDGADRVVRVQLLGLHAVVADGSLERRPAPGAAGLVHHLQGRVLAQLGVDQLLELHRGELEHVVHRHQSGRHLHLRGRDLRQLHAL
jgi:hypothetical protein